MNTIEDRNDAAPLVSIVIDNFNYARFLPAAIDSALAQTYSPIEVIVVDDGSTDNSREIVARYGDRVVSVFKANGGHASAFNAGFRASHGGIVMFLDADDMLLPTAVEEVVRAWHPGTAKAQFVLAHIDAQGRLLGGTVPYAPAQMPNGDIRESILSSGGYIGAPTSGNAFARMVLENLLPLPEPQWHQAADTSLEILAPFFGDVVSLEKTLGYYRVHESNHGMIGDSLDARKLRVKIVIDLQREVALREFGSHAGFALAPGWAALDPGHPKYRLASLRIDPSHHPIIDDTRASLMLQGIAASWKNRRYNLRSRLFQLAWFPLVAFLPQSSALRLIRWDFYPRGRRAAAPLSESRQAG
jgi:glycosyltransferase involved in cell wall biosynthesis